MIIFRRKFRPGWLVTLITIAGCTLFFSLGLWQMERAAYKDSIEQKFETRLEGDYVRMNIRRALADIEFRKLELHGNYDQRRTMLVDNQLYHGRAGYHVLSPFELSDSEDIVLVNRGWIAVGNSRERLPAIEPPVTSGIARGIASIPGEDPFRMGQVSLQDSWPQLVPFIDIESMQEKFDGRLLPLILWLGPEQPGHYAREWNPVWLKPEKSRAYAWQWFAFGAISLILFLVLNLRNENEKK
jgi:surfeit locus 1 family protein